MFKHIALPAPDARVKSQMYIQHYMAHFPSAGEVVIFDRSWYNRAGVEPVMGSSLPPGSRHDARRDQLGVAPWHIVDNHDKKRGRLNIITHLLSQIPYDPPGADRCEDAQAAEP